MAASSVTTSPAARPPPRPSRTSADEEQQRARRVAGDVHGPVVRLGGVGDPARCTRPAWRAGRWSPARCRGTRTGGRARRRSPPAPSTSASASSQASPAAYDASSSRRHDSRVGEVDGVPPRQHARCTTRGQRAPADARVPRRRAAAGSTARATSQSNDRRDRHAERAAARDRRPAQDARTHRRRRARPADRSRQHFVSRKGVPRAVLASLRWETWTPACDLVLPCRDEGPALEALLPRVPDAYRVIVVDNGSTDDTADVARRLGATVVTESRPGYGAAVHAGSGGGHGRVRRVHGRRRLLRPRRARAAARRRPRRAAPTWPSGAGGRPAAGSGRGTPAPATRWSSPGCAAGSGCRPTTSRRCASAAAQALLDLGVRDRAFGYPVELLQKADARRLAVRRARRHLPPARRGHPLEGVRLGARHAAHRPRLRAGAVVTRPDPGRRQGARRPAW